MTLGPAIQGLGEAVGALMHSVHRVRLAACEDCPSTGRTMFADAVCNWALDLYGAAYTMERELGTAQPGPDRAAAEVLLATVDEQALAIELLLLGRAVDGDHATAMRRQTTRPGGWSEWADVTGDATAGCLGPLTAVRQALLHCWRELAQRPEIRLDKATVDHLSVADGSTMAARQEG
jgi:hypothetical protein